MAILLVAFFALLMFGIPVAAVMGISSTLYLLSRGADLLTIPQRMFAGADNFTLMAIPLYIFAGEIMNRCGITRRIFNFASEIVGFLPGGLALVNVLASTMFAGISGSTSADVASLGVMEIAGMEEAGYSRSYSTAITCASATIGSIIPPSILMVLYSSITGISCGKLFVAGMVPGLMVCLSQMAFCFYKAKRDPVNCDGNYRPKFNGKRLLFAAKDAIPAMIMPGIIIGGTLSGVFTATEAGAVAGLYGILVGVFYYREFRVVDMYETLKSTAFTVGQSSLIFAATSIFSYCVAILKLPNKLSAWITGLTTNVYLILFLMILAMMIIGCFMDTTPAAIIMVPIFQPLAAALGFDSIHFGMVMVLTFIFGGITPPVGATLFIASSVGDIPLSKLVKDMWPLILLFFIVMMLVAYFPPLSTTLPALVA
ncbi:tripartite ATP-independent transporter DctM subunit [Fusobacterium naviforme]|uniref:Tripartite ATP-independent transporter DctM subunit n=1 Tax=Moryella indoligenes TaxID=371674 RepID=A0AAE3V9E6_9FIRM|nr:TRAP transporter large permease [Moryella indoligenes]KAB0578341.1 TRAP transporter large permease [Fusobacterium naviforme]MDQ0152207.1 tripartite ATP-independent transporter DctM subunit [Moryella indoligenes]PSL11047.1 tripartite ATP-independent transporter DctM subunit [Fusobacterium naviforme]STO28421.1 Neu5Ac permease [Fusobacterium naviforme]